MVDGLPKGYRFLNFEELGSTNDEARNQIFAGAAPGLVVTAERQTAGRGRRGRAWSSNTGNLYVSVTAAMAGGPAHAAELSFVAALATYDVLSEWITEPGTLKLKWPNDVLANGRKMTGILLETASAPDSDQFQVIVGIGINLVTHPADSEVQMPASDVLELTGKSVPPLEVAAKLATAFEMWRQSWADEGFGAIRTAWLQRARGLGETITVRLPDRTFDGIFEDLNQNGAIIVRKKDGSVEHVTAGDVFFPDVASN